MGVKPTCIWCRCRFDKYEPKERERVKVNGKFVWVEIHAICLPKFKESVKPKALITREDWEKWGCA